MHIKVSKQICLLGLIEVSYLYFSALRELARLIHVQDVMKGFGYGCCVSSTTHKTAFPDLSLLLRKERVQLSVYAVNVVKITVYCLCSRQAVLFFKNVAIATKFVGAA